MGAIAVADGVTDGEAGTEGVDDVDACHARAIAAGYKPEAEARDAPWGERFFHIRDPDGHELSFARPLATGPE